MVLSSRFMLSPSSPRRYSPRLSLRCLPLFERGLLLLDGLGLCGQLLDDTGQRIRLVVKLCIQQSEGVGNGLVGDVPVLYHPGEVLILPGKLVNGHSSKAPFKKSGRMSSGYAQHRISSMPKAFRGLSELS